jgi:ATP-dependent Clp protease ATP-binding subunit ClpC
MSKDEELKKTLLEKELKNFFTPEFLNRVDEIVMFNSLKEKEVEQIVLLELSKLSKRLDKMGYHITFTEELVSHLAKEGFDEKYGARPIKRAIQEKVEDLISEEVLRKNIQIGKSYSLTIDEQEEIKVGEI